MSGAIGKSGWGDIVRRSRNELSCQFYPRANGMHCFEGAAEGVGERAEQFKPLGVDVWLGFAAEALIAIESKPDRLRSTAMAAFRVMGDSGFRIRVSSSGRLGLVKDACKDVRTG